MSERFPDDVLLKIWLSGEIASNQTLRETTSQAYADKARIVAMRAVLEGHLAEQETEHPTVTCECPHTPDCPLVASDGSPR